MSFEILQTLSIISYILAAIMFVTAIILFFVLHVPKLFGYITGSSARKAISDIHSQSESNEHKVYNPDLEKNSSASINNRQVWQNDGLDSSVGTEKLSNESSKFVDNARNKYSDSGNQDKLQYSKASEETTVLMTQNDDIATTILNENSTAGFSIEVELGFLGSSEIIE